MSILVTGARGNIGRRLVRVLASAGHDVRGSARDVADLAVPAGVERVALDITDPATFDRALAGVETVFLYPAHGDISLFLAAVEASDVRHVVQLSSPASYDAHEYDGWIGRVHRRIEQSLVESGVPHTLLYPSWLATNTMRDWAAGIRAHNRLRIAYPDARYTPIHPEDIAEAAANLLTRPDFRGRWQIITGPESMRMRDVAAVLAEVRGMPVAVEELTREEALAERPEWMPEAAMESLLDVSAASVGVPALVNNGVERLTGHPARTFREWAEENRGAFLG